MRIVGLICAVVVCFGASLPREVFSQSLECVSEPSPRCVSVQEDLAKLDRAIAPLNDKLSVEQGKLNQINGSCDFTGLTGTKLATRKVWCKRQSSRVKSRINALEKSLKQINKRVAALTKKKVKYCAGLCESGSFDLSGPIPANGGGEGGDGIFVSQSLTTIGENFALGASLGRALDVDSYGDVIIGAPKDKVNGFKSGAAYILSDRDDTGAFTKAVRLVPSVASNNAEFGGQVVISRDGNIALISEINLERVSVFEKVDGIWERRQQLQASNYEPGDGFGSALAISEDGDQIFVGAPGEDSRSEAQATSNSMSNSGAVYVFARAGNQWIELRMLKEPTVAKYTGCGRTLAYSDQILAIGCPYALPANGNRGRVQMFTGSGANFNHLQKLELASVVRYGSFGFSLDLLSGTLVIGAAADGQSSRGKAYVYRYVGASMELAATLDPTDLPLGSRFGSSVAVSSNRIAVGAPDAVSAEGAYGIVKTYRIDGDGSISAEASLTSPLAGTWNKFGAAVSLDGDKLAVGDPNFNSSPGSYTGAMHLFSAINN